MKVTFIKIGATGWNGNGFGSVSASWVALVGDVVVGMWDGDLGRGDVFGSFGWVGIRSPNSWKAQVKKAAAAGL